jgi:hypothetical protein
MANLNSLAALAALGYMASKGFGGNKSSTETPSNSLQSTPSEPTGVEGGDQYMGELTGVEGGDQFIPQKTVRNASAATKSATKTKPTTQGNPRDLEAGMGRGSRPSDARDREAGMSRGTQYGSSAYATPSYTGQGGGGRGGQGGPSASQLAIADTFTPPSSEQTQAGLETAMGGGPGLKAMSSMAKSLAGASKPAKTAAMQAWERAQMAERMTPVRSSAAPAAQQAGREAVTNPLEWAMGPKNSSMGRKALSEADTTGGAIGYRKGGAIKKMAKCGLTSKPMSSASSRGDGIASKGKTRGKIC